VNIFEIRNEVMNSDRQGYINNYETPTD